MKDQRKGEGLLVVMFMMVVKQFLQGRMGIYMKVGFPAQQIEGAEKTEEPKGMITMYVGNQDMVYLSVVYITSPNPDLGTLTAIN
jgi:hypothetical protein